MTTREGQNQRHTRVVAAVALLALALYGWWLIDNRVRNVGGTDSSGYVNAAKMIREGKIVLVVKALGELGLPAEDARLFTPLGFSPGPVPGTIVPYYPPGFPVHIAVAAEVLGWERGPHVVVPLAGVVAVLLTFLIARQMGLDLGWSLAAAAILAFYPTFAFQSIQAMSDVLATCWSCAAILFALKAHGKHAWAVAAGAAFGVSVLVRPSNVLLVPGLLLALPWTLRSLGMFITGGAPFGAIFMVYNRIAFGNPLSTGYASDLAGNDLELTYFRTRFLHYGFWLNRLLTPLIPIGWIASMWIRHLPARRRLLLLAWFLPFFLFYCNYRHYDTWWYTRFLLPATPALIIGAMFSARDLAGLSMRLGREMNRRALARTLTAITMVLFIVWVELSFVRDKVAGFRHGERVYAASALAAPARVTGPAYVFSMQTSGALQYYGSATPVRWDVANDRQLEALETAFASRGIGWYATLFPFEVEAFLRKMPGEWQQIDSWDHVSLWTRTDI